VWRSSLKKACHPVRSVRLSPRYFIFVFSFAFQEMIEPINALPGPNRSIRSHRSVLSSSTTQLPPASYRLHPRGSKNRVECDKADSFVSVTTCASPSGKEKDDLILSSLRCLRNVTRTLRLHTPERQSRRLSSRASSPSSPSEILGARLSQKFRCRRCTEVFASVYQMTKHLKSQCLMKG
jgi:hypothetical protein